MVFKKPPLNATEHEKAVFYMEQRSVDNLLKGLKEKELTNEGAKKLQIFAINKVDSLIDNDNFVEKDLTIPKPPLRGLWKHQKQASINVVSRVDLDVLLDALEDKDFSKEEVTLLQKVSIEKIDDKFGDKNGA